MNSSLFLSIFSILAVVYLIIGVMASKRIKTNDDYFLAGRGLGLSFLVFTLIATHIGGGAILGTAEESYSYGFAGVLYNLGFAVGFIILSFGFAAKLRSFNVVTTAELFEKKYNSIFLRKVASFLSAASMCGILAATVVAARSSFLGLGIQSEFILVLFWLFVIAYTMLGGLKAVVATDVFQVSVIISVFVGIFIYTFWDNPSSLINFDYSAFTVGNKFSTGSLLSIFLLPIFYSFIEQDFAQRFFAAKNKRTATLAALISGTFIILFSFIPVYLGMKARLMGIVVSRGISPLVVFMEQTMSELVVVLVLCSIFAAITSTADSLLCAISSNVAQDFEFKFLRIKNRLRFSQVVTFLTGMLAFVIAYRFDNIIGLMSHSYDLLVSCLWISVFFCFFRKKLQKEAAVFSVSFGFVAFIIFKLFPPIGIPVVLLSLGVSLIGYLVGPRLVKLA